MKGRDASCLSGDAPSLAYYTLQSPHQTLLLEKLMTDTAKRDLKIIFTMVSRDFI